MNIGGLFFNQIYITILVFFIFFYRKMSFGWDNGELIVAIMKYFRWDTLLYNRLANILEGVTIGSNLFYLHAVNYLVSAHGEQQL